MKSTERVIYEQTSILRQTGTPRLMQSVSL